MLVLDSPLPVSVRWPRTINFLIENTYYLILTADLKLSSYHDGQNIIFQYRFDVNKKKFKNIVL